MTVYPLDWIGERCYCLCMELVCWNAVVWCRMVAIGRRVKIDFHASCWDPIALELGCMMNSKHLVEAAEVRLATDMVEHSFGIVERSMVNRGIRSSQRFRRSHCIGIDQVG